MHIDSSSSEAMRRWFAEEIRWASGVTNERIISAFAEVPRELFLPKGPWQISTAMILESYRITPDAQPHHLYHNVMVAIDSCLELNSALPSYVASLIEIASIKEGAFVAQVGAGLGYYSAILSHVVGPIGSIIALEIDPKIWNECQSNLTSYSNVRCVNADGSTYPLQADSLDALVVHGAVTHIPPRWLRSLREGSRLVLPLSYAPDEPGRIARITRIRDRYWVEFHQEVFTYPCIGTFSEEDAETLREAVETYGWYTDSELRFDLDNADESAWLITPHYWISMAERGESFSCLEEHSGQLEDSTGNDQF